LFALVEFGAIPEMLPSYRALSVGIRDILASYILLLAANGVAAEISLQDALDTIVESHQGDIAVAVKCLETGETYVHEAERPMPTASLIKFPLLIATCAAVEQGNCSWDDTITLQQSDMVPGSGILTTHFSPGLQLSLRDAARLMMAYSDNTATNLVIDRVGLARVTEVMDKLNCPETKLNSKVFRRDTSIHPERSEQFGLGSTTASEMAKLLELLQQDSLVSAEACATMRQHMVACQDRGQLLRNLPSQLKAPHKTGAVTEVRTDAGILPTASGHVVVCVLTANNQDKRWTEDNAAEIVIANIGQAVWNHFGGAAATSESSSMDLALGASGASVEALQRTLNARLEPSPDLAVDGEFGPQTLAAVKRYQAFAGLEENGRVSAAVWKSLEPLVMSDPVKSQGGSPPRQADAPAKLPYDALDGPPLVTCKAWAIGDAATGEILWEQAANESLHPASTTKIMTAWLVCKLAIEQPTILDEIVTFSENADKTPGSSSTLRAGEQLSVRELLYGLLLPSGNDASVALAEHFGDRVTASDATTGGAAQSTEGPNKYEDFIKAMNHEAQRLGLNHTSFRNSHGLTADGHRSTAADLLRLAHLALQNQHLAHYVATTQHPCQVVQPSGETRTVLWKNTNRLLATSGFLGVKTGTTDAAGACLVSSQQRDGRQLIVVVLGSANNDARYVDTRNLYRWAWGLRTKD
jgi:D-alanyl-D-alanine carboxypeptidase (penicillin-binding protein 5/6)